MRRQSATPFLAVALLLTVLPGATLLAAVNQYVEDFSTKTYCDTLNTTALWDTDTGELSLHPFEVSLVGSSGTPDDARDVAIAGDCAYIAGDASGLQVVDISDPTSPVLIGSYNTSGYAIGVAIAGNRAFVADGSSGLQLIDITDPTAPILDVSLTCGYSVDVALSGDYAYVASSDSGLVVVDISDPSNPATWAGSYQTPDYARCVAISGDHAYVADGNSGLQVIDISDPTNPVLAGSYQTPDYAFGVAIAGDHAYVADNSSGLLVVDISDPTNPVLAGSYDTPGHAYGVAISGDQACVADHDFGVLVVDISDPTNPVPAGSHDTPGNALGVAVDGEHAYVADSASGLQVLRICEPMNPEPAGSCLTPGTARSIAVAGDYAYVADYITGGLQVFDVGDPASPVWAGSYDTPGGAYDVAVEGNHAYVADGDSGLQVLDISDPTVPVLVGSSETYSSARGVAIAGNNAYIADWEYFTVMDVSDPADPTIVGFSHIMDYVEGLAVSGNYACLAARSVLEVIWIHYSFNPYHAGHCNAPDYAVDVAISGDYAYVADYTYGLRVIDISIPWYPASAGSCATPGNARGVAVSGNHAYVADADNGLQVFDITDPTTPTLTGSCDTPVQARGVAIAGDHAYVADGGGVQVIEATQHSVALQANSAQSLDVEPGDDDVMFARLSTAQTDSVSWVLSANGGVNWQTTLPDSGWQAFAYPGSQLLWRSTHEYVGGQVNPTCALLTIDWLYERPTVASVEDIPDDQGRQVRVSWVRSGHDHVGSSTPITEYAIFRRVDGSRAAAAGAKLTMADSQQTLRYPPGSWDFVATVPAYTEDEYAVVVPTLADSTISGGMSYSVFFVRAGTAEAGVYFDSPPDSGYSVDNLAPSVPRGFAVDYSATENELAWEESEDEDFQYFRVYRGTDPEFVPGPGNLVHMTTGIGWVDSVTEGWQYHYKITALDFSGNESDAASPESVTGVDEPGMPGRYALYQNVPNPLNPTTVIRYDVPSGGGKVTLEIFDVSGRLVRRLLDRHETAGRRSVAWDGKDERGSSAASGVYYYRLVAPGYEKTLKMMVVK